MAVKLRLVRMGKKKQPTYRVVAADSRSPRDGRFIEMLGVYAPRGVSREQQDAVIRIDIEKTAKWLANGAKPTDRVAKLISAAESAAVAEAKTAPSPAAAVPPAEPTVAEPTVAERTVAEPTAGEAPDEVAAGSAAQADVPAPGGELDAPEDVEVGGEASEGDEGTVTP